jgi:dimethylhistidine N-methyltransferase
MAQHKQQEGYAMTALARAPLSRREQPVSFSDDVILGLTGHPKQIPPKYFYDERGSRLFEAITRLPEYYPTRTEMEILRREAGAITALLPDDAVLVEFGAGSAAKARILLEASGRIAAYVPVDISADYLLGEAERLKRDLPRLQVQPVLADFTRAFSLPAAASRKSRIGFFPGSTIGNFEPNEAAAFLRHAARLLGPGAVLVMGVDLVKAPEILHAAYNDSAGVTAAFNLNLLARVNRELGGDFDLSRFAHRAFYNALHRRIEMHLASLRRQTVRIAGVPIPFAEGETIHTENSYKYTPESFAALARGAGWMPLALWTDPRRFFAVYAFETVTQKPH